MATYRKKKGVSVIEVFRLGIDVKPQWFEQALNEKIITIEKYREHGKNRRTIEKVKIRTRSGVAMYATHGEYLYKDKKGAIYIMTKEYFKNNYERVGV